MEEKNYLEKISETIAELENQKDIDAASRIIARTREIRQKISAECGEDSDEMHEACNLIAQKCLQVLDAAKANLAGKKSNEEEMDRINEVILRLSALPISDEELKSRVSGNMKQMEVANEEMDKAAGRPGCITVWLIVCMIVQGISLLRCFSSFKYASVLGEYEWLLYYELVATLMAIGGLVLLMCWRKIGFFILLGVAILTTVLTVAFLPSELYSISSCVSRFVGPLVWYGILQKTNSRGVKFWSMLK